MFHERHNFRNSGFLLPAKLFLSGSMITGMTHVHHLLLFEEQGASLSDHRGTFYLHCSHVHILTNRATSITSLIRIHFDTRLLLIMRRAYAVIYIYSSFKIN